MSDLPQMMADDGFDLDDLFVDPEIAEAGVWVDFYGGSRLKVGSTESKKYKSLMARLAKKHRIALDDANSESFEIVQEITAEALASTVLKDWRGINMNGQRSVSYTPVLGKQAIMRSAKLRDFVVEKAGDPSLFRTAPATLTVQVQEPSSELPGPSVSAPLPG